MGFAHSIIGNEVIGYWYKELPNGCKLCMKGSKIVIFVTGVCGIDCYYCPISRERRLFGAFYVDEEKVDNATTILDEASIVKAEGASITGGEPMQRYDLVVNIIHLLKDAFGQKFHIHLYTSGFGATRNAIKYLDKIGLDEIRFHIVSESVWKLVEYSVKETSMDVGIEIPVIPGEEDNVWETILKANSIGVKFVNLNEMEVSETNVERVLFRGFKIRENGRSVVGSAETAKNILIRAQQHGINTSIHFCTVQFKDFVQQRARTIRKARTCMNVGDEVTEDGMIIREGVEMEPRLSLCAPIIRKSLFA